MIHEHEAENNFNQTDQMEMEMGEMDHEADTT